MARLNSGTRIYGNATIDTFATISGNLNTVGGNVNIANGTTVTAVTRSTGGSGYTGIISATVSAPTTVGGVQATAQAYTGAITTAVVNGGSGYTAGDILTVVGGTGTAITIQVTTVSLGVITGINQPGTGSSGYGSYTALPTNPVSVTGGTGSSATFNLSNFSLISISVINAGSGYVAQPTVTFSGGGGSGATAFATIGFQSIIRGLGTSTGTITNQSIMFQTPSGNSLLLRDPNNSTPDAHVMVGATPNGYAQVMAEGTNANASLYIGAKGSGSVRFSTNSTGITEQFRVSHTASAVNYVQVTGSTANNGVTISAQGTGTNLDVIITPKGTGNLASTGNVSATGNIAANNISTSNTISAFNNMIINSNGVEGGQLIMAWANTSGITGQANSTWNIDVDTGNNFRVFYQNAAGATNILVNASPTTNVVTFTNVIKTATTVFASLPAAATAGAGARAFITDANTVTFASTVTGGASNSVPVFSNGTNWLVG